ncbi:hypothetical protein KKG22_03685 [Patescibacteria group bacterium]|nr:hypothetical protein [Patescibacteria group bacterium]MBU1721248.1 hypothetical protein [Patescibacteria group bacterium]MBU1901044.1 hypothetical protein [Patescibacteria group bacterium]
MKKIFVFLALFCCFVALPVYAIDLGAGLVADTAEKAGYENVNDISLAENVGYMIRLLLSFVGTIFLVLMVYAGYLWMTARGDEGKVDKAMDIIKAAIIGLIITVGAYSITAFVVPKIVARSAASSNASQTPQLNP